MKTPSSELRRDIILVGGAALFAFVPLFLLWRKSTTPPLPFTPGVRAPRSPFPRPPLPSVAQRQPVAAPLSREREQPKPRPVVGRLVLSSSSSSSGKATLSPNGLWLARMESTPLPPGATPAPSTSSPTLDNLVIRSTADGKEAFRTLRVGEFVGWIPGSTSFVTLNANIIHVFAPAAHRPGAPFWTQKTITLPSRDADSSSYSSQDFDLQTGAIEFSPDFRFAVKGYWGHENQGNIEWQVADLATGRIAPPVRMGRWLNFNPNVGGYSNDISIAVAPANIASGGLPLVSVLQTLEPLPDYSATPTPQPTVAPTPIPKPTPTYSPTQAAFVARETRELAEIQRLVDSVLGVDGADPKVTNEKEIARITVEVKRRNRALEAERVRLFPLAQKAVPLPAPTATFDGFDTPFQVETFDLNARTRLWSAPLRTEVFQAEMKFSPDGSALVIWRTTAPRVENGDTRSDGVGFEFRAARSGRLLGKSRLYLSDFSIPGEGELQFYDDSSVRVNGTDRSVLVVKDAYEGMNGADGKFQPYLQGTAFRFFNAFNGRERGYVKTDVPQQGFEGFSISQNGKVWLWGQEELVTVSRKKLGRERSGMLPAPTPDPAMVQVKHVSGR